MQTTGIPIYAVTHISCSALGNDSVLKWEHYTGVIELPSLPNVNPWHAHSVNCNNLRRICPSPGLGAQLPRRQEPLVAHLAPPANAQDAKHHLPLLVLDQAVAPRLLDDEAALLDLARVQHGLLAPADLPVAVSVPQPALQVQAHAVQLHDVLAAVLELGLHDPPPPLALAFAGQRGRSGRRQRPDFGAHDERALADELVQLAEGARAARRLGGLVVAHRHGEHVVALLFEVEVDDALQRLARLEVRALAPLAIPANAAVVGAVVVAGAVGPEQRQLEHGAGPGRLHLGLDAHVARELLLRRRQQGGR